MRQQPSISVNPIVRGFEETLAQGGNSLMQLVLGRAPHLKPASLYPRRLDTNITKV